VISIFHETKIRTVDMKVQVYSKFRKNKISKKVKSPNYMRNARFDTSKCRGSLKKWMYCTPILPKPQSTLIGWFQPVIFFFNISRQHRKRGMEIFTSTSMDESICIHPKVHTFIHK
jgi:hypothetical protein